MHVQSCWFANYKLTDWPYYASRIRRRSGLAVVYVKYLVVFHVLRIPVYIWNRIARSIRILSFFGHPWKFLKAHFSMMSPKFRCQARVRHPSEKIQPTQNTVREGGYFIREIISPSGEMVAHASPFFMNVFLNTSLPWGVIAQHCTASTSREFYNIWQSKRVGIIAIKNKRTRIRFHRYSPGGRGILNSLTWGIDWWRKKKLLPVTVLEPSVVFA